MTNDPRPPEARRIEVDRGAAIEWRRFMAATFPLVALSITDDELMTERGTRVLVDCYANAPGRAHRAGRRRGAAHRPLRLLPRRLRPDPLGPHRGLAQRFNLAKETTT